MHVNRHLCRCHQKKKKYYEIIEEIHKLPEMYSVVFVLFVLEEFTHTQIARQLGIDEKTSRTRLVRARKMVKKALYKRSISVLGK